MAFPGSNLLVKAIRVALNIVAPPQVDIPLLGPSYQQEVMADEPVFLYIADTATLTRLAYNNATATADGTNNGTASGNVYVAPPLMAQGMYSTLGALYFDYESAGGNTTANRPHVLVPHFAERRISGDFAFECLFNLTEFQGSNCLYACHHRYFGTEGWAVQVNANGQAIQFLYYNPAVTSRVATVNFAPGVQLGQDHHLVVNVDQTVNNEIEVFLDGVSKGTAPLPVTVLDTTTEDGTISGWTPSSGIAGSGGNVQYIKGTISHVAQYDRVLSAADILRHSDAIPLSLEWYTPNTEYYADLITADSPNLFVNFNAPEQGSSTAGVTDTSGNGNNGTIFGEVQRGNLGLSSAGSSMALIPNASTHAGVKIPYDATLQPQSGMTFIASVVPLSLTAGVPSVYTSSTCRMISLGDTVAINLGSWSCSFSVRPTDMVLGKYVSGSTTTNVFSDTFASAGLPDVEVGKLYHFAVTIDNSISGDVKFYRDGVQVGATKTLPSVIPNHSASYSSYIGTGSDFIVANAGSYEILDNVAYFPSILTPERIKAYASTTSALQVSNLDDYVARWSMDGVTLPTGVPETPNNSYDLDDVLADTGGVNLTNTGSVTFAGDPAPNQTGNSAVFNGSSYLNTASTGAFQLQQFSIGVWLKNTNLTGSQSVVGCYYRDTGATNTWGWDIVKNSSNGLFFTGYNGNTDGGGNTIAGGANIGYNILVNQWYHFGVTVDTVANQVKIYINGRLAKTVTSTGSISYADSNIEFRIGDRKINTASVYQWNGNIDSVKFYSSVLTDAQMLNLSTTGYVPDNSADQRVGTYDGYGLPVNSPTRTIGYDALTDGALSFNGVDQYVALPDVGALKPTNLTVSAWIKTTSTSSGVIIDNNNYRFTIVDGYSLYIRANGTLGATVGRNTGNNTVDTAFIEDQGMPINDGIWHHVAVTYDGAEAKAYIDGVNTFTDAYTGGVVYDTDAFPRIGYRDDASTKTLYFDGDMDDVRLYDRALSTAEILYLAKTTIPPKPQDMIAEWKFESNATDSVGTNDLTVSNAQYSVDGWEGSCWDGSGGLDRRATLPTTNDTFNLQTFSVSVFVKFPVHTDNQLIVGNASNVSSLSEGWQLAVTSTGSVYYFETNEYPGGGAAYSASKHFFYNEADASVYKPPTDAWIHLCAVRTPTTLEVYVNGEPSTSPIFFNGDTALQVIGYSSDTSFTVGARDRGASYDDYFRGQIDEVRFYDRELTAEEVKALALRDDVPVQPTPLPPVPQDMIHHFKLNGDLTNSGPAGTQLFSQGTPTYETAVFGQGAYMPYVDGTAAGNYIYDNVQNRANFAIQTFSVSFWFRPRATVNSMNGTLVANVWIDYATADNRGWRINVSKSGYTYFDCFNGTATIDRADLRAAVAFNNTTDYHHVTVVRTPTEQITYYDGVLVDSITPTGSISYQTIKERFTIGSGYQVNGYWNSCGNPVDDVRFYDRAVTANEVAALYAEGNP